MQDTLEKISRKYQMKTRRQRYWRKIEEQPTVLADDGKDYVAEESF